MATTTQPRFRELLSRAIGYYQSGAATGGSTSTIVDASANGGFNARADTETIGKWAHILVAGSAAPENETRKVSAVSTTTATVDPVYSATVANTDTYELLPYHTDELNDAIREAIRTVPLHVLYLPLRDQTLTIDDRLTNGSLNTFSTTFTGWTHTVGTWTQETAITFEGSSAAKGVASGANAQLTQAWQGSISEIAGQTAIARFHVLATAASVARVGIDFGNSIAISWSSYHSGKSSGTGIGQWEPLEVSVAVPAEAASVTVILEVTDGSTGYFDWGGGLRINEIDRYTIPSSFVNVPTRVLQMANDYEPDGDYLPITGHNRAVRGRLMRLEGKGRLTVPSAESSTVEVDEPQAETIVARAAQILFRRLANSQPSNHDRHLDRAKEFEQQYRELAGTPGNRSMPMTADAWPNWGGAGITEDSTARYLRLLR
jgi:hypothetical protein